MANPARMDDSVTAGRLRHDHRSFDERLTAMCRRARADGWSVMAGVWSGFSADMVRHVSFEEVAVFPAFAAHKSGEAMLLAQLADDHEELRRLLDRLTNTIVGGRADVGELADLQAAMTSHEDRENTRIYPWLELQNRRSNPRGRSAR